MHSLRASSIAVTDRSALGGKARPSGLWVPPEAGSLVVAHRGASTNSPNKPWPPTRKRCGRAPTASNATSGSPRTGTWSASTTNGWTARPNGTGRVSDMTLAEMQALDYGGWHPSRELGDAQGDTGLLTLERLMQLVVDP